MSEQLIYVSNNAQNYSVGLKKMIMDLSEEMTNGIKDGLAYKLARVENDEAKLYSFVKTEGYDLTFKEFSGFISDAKDMITANEEFINDILSEKIAEFESEELDDNDLEQVVGGNLKWWQILLICFAVVALVVACIIAAPLVAGVGAAVGTVVAAGGTIAAGGVFACSAVVAGSAAAALGTAVATGTLTAVAIGASVVAGVS